MAMTKDGDLREVFAKMVERRVPYATNISKVKAHATWEMVGTGEAKEEIKIGDDVADKAADRGATKCQMRTKSFADV